MIAARFATQTSRRLVLASGMVCAAVAISGCAGYQIGNAGLYPAGIETVAVPVFDSTSFRPYLGERLTEAVIKQVELQTPYRVTNESHADSVLWGRIVSDAKRVSAETGTDEPRELEFVFYVQVSWTDRSGATLQSRTISLPSSLLTIQESAYTVPEVGQSVAVGQQDAIEDLARQIVFMMENPW